MARFNFTIDDATGLDDLAQETGRRSKADVVRDALALYEYLLERHKKGQVMFLGVNKEDATEFHVTTFEAARKRALRAAGL